MADTNNQGQGFAGMDDQKHEEISRKGGQSQGKDNNPGNFANDKDKAHRAGKEGGSKSQNS